MIDEETKTCRICNVEKPLSDYTLRRAQCKPCRAAYTRRYYRANPEKVKETVRRYNEKHADRLRARSRELHLNKTYGLTTEQYERMCTLQNGHCEICLRVPKQLVIDHDHATGKIRGLLCGDCNRGLGLFRDKPDTLKAAAWYLREWEE